MDIDNAYKFDRQKYFIEFLISDQNMYERCASIVKEEFFNPQLTSSVRFIIDHVSDYGKIPALENINTATDINFKTYSNEYIAENSEWFMTEFNLFCRKSALEIALGKSKENVDNLDVDSVESIIKEASEIGLAKNLGVNYWHNPEERIKRILDNGKKLSTGWKAIDDAIYGGFHKGELNIFAGAPGAGKSLFLQNITLNYCLDGLNCVYITLELSEDLCGMRFDSMLSGFPTKEIKHNIENVALKVAATGKKSGDLRIVRMGSGCNINDIKAFVKEYQIQKKINVDAAGKRLSSDDIFGRDKYVSEELRNMAMDGGVLLVTASQLNRTSITETDYNNSHIAGGISKINTADNVMAISDNIAERDNGVYSIQFLKTRSSAGVGKRIKLAYDRSTMRITDMENWEEEAETKVVNGVYNKMDNEKLTNIINRKNSSNATETSSDKISEKMKKMNKIMEKTRK